MKTNIEVNQIQGKREYQQDTYGYRDLANFKLCFLADGMGGYKGGEIASEIIIQSFMKSSSSHVNTKSFLENTLNNANQEIASYKKSHPDVSKMGTTLIAMLIKENTYQWISVGDSPLYRIRANKIERINQNHSVAGLLNLQVKNGEISQEEANSDTNKHMLTSAIMGEDISIIDISDEYELMIDDIFILASDGIETLSLNEISTMLKEEKNTKLLAKNILNKITKKNKPNQDNASLMILSFKNSKNKENYFWRWIKNL